MTEQVVLVDERDNELGSEEKGKAHELALLHRALSVFIFDGQGRLLIQKRAAGKYHSPGLWANSCCSHPRPAESVEAAAQRRCQEELGMAVAVRNGGTFTYKCAVGDAMWENEYVHLFWALSDDPCRPDPSEIETTAWLPIDELLRWQASSERDQLAPWFALYLDKLRQELLDWSGKATLEASAGR